MLGLLLKAGQFSESQYSEWPTLPVVDAFYANLQKAGLLNVQA